MCLHPTPVYRLAPVWSCCVCRLSAGAHTHAHTCAWGHAGTCGGTQAHTGSPLVVTSTHTEQVCIPPGHRCALNTRVLCTLVCFTSCDTCIWGERRVCVFTHRIMACAGRVTPVPMCRVPGGRSGLGLRLPFTPRWLFLLVLPALGFPQTVCFLMPWCLR